MADRKQNCWEYKQCGREPGGERADALGICPAASDKSFHGINFGEYGGRVCWAVAGTFCNGDLQGSFAEKRTSCITCDFFQQVQKEEGDLNRQGKFLKFIESYSERHFISQMSFIHIEAGKRFITQGDVGDKAYIIQKGTCLVIVEKDGKLYPAAHYGKGDIVGGMGILTGEPRLAHCEAETDMDLFVLKKEQFDHLSEKDPELLSFLTEIVADRFDSNRPTAYRTIGKYLTTDIIGRGGYSVVYKGLHSLLNMPVAIKMLRHNMAIDKDFLHSFYGEAIIIAGLNHENIVKIYDIEERYKTVFIIMELLVGESLKALIHHLGKIPFQLSVKYLLQICSGLNHAHKNGIIHRDINPTNIIIESNDRVKILDFGLSCLIGTEDYNSLGTVFYMAPEQISGDVVDRYTDVYALGIMAYEMVTGKRPFPEETIFKVREAHLKDDIPDPAKIVPEIPEVLRKFILKAGRCKPEQRYQNIDQVIEDLHVFVDKYGLDTTQTFSRTKLVNLCLMYDENRQREFSKLVEEFSLRAKDIGVTLKIADFKDA